ncbi:MAG TPA: DMT family transporter, partial [Prolixibacteraceae bacterium]|nr:DMT family transporter [Prolixibacteraceae bacterium]
RSQVEMKNELEYLGIGLLLLNNLISGYSNVLVAKSPVKMSPMVLSSTTLILGGMLLFVVSIPVEGINLGPFPTKYYYALGWLSFLSAAAFTIWYSLLKRPYVKVSILNVWKFLIPVSGAILSWVILEDEHPDFLSILGMAVIATSLITLSLANRRAKIQKNQQFN